MEIALVLIGIVTIVLVGVLIVSNKRNRESAEEIERQKGEAEEEHSHTPPMACCGAHEVCEAETLLALSDKIIYYDDEELDAYVCQVNLDEDEMISFVSGQTGRCPYYRYYDEYKSVHKQI